MSLTCRALRILINIDQGKVFDACDIDDELATFNINKRFIKLMLTAANAYARENHLETYTEFNHYNEKSNDAKFAYIIHMVQEGYVSPYGLYVIDYDQEEFTVEGHTYKMEPIRKKANKWMITK